MKGIKKFIRHLAESSPPTELEVYASNAFDYVVDNCSDFIAIDMESSIGNVGNGPSLKGGALNVKTGAYIYVNRSGLAITFQRGSSNGSTHELGAVFSTKEQIDRCVSAYVDHALIDPIGDDVIVGGGRLYRHENKGAEL